MEVNGKEHPYRATRLWNETVSSFCKGIPLRRHRRHFKNYDNCFIASDAVDWLLEYLVKHSEMGQRVTRLQALQLLQKFEKCQIIQAASHPTKIAFQDDRKIYKLIWSSPSKTPSNYINRLLKTPLKLRHHEPKTHILAREQKKKFLSLTQSGFPSHHKRGDDVKEHVEDWISTSSLSVDEIEEVWNSVFWNRLSSVFGARLTEILHPGNVSGKVVQHNATKIGKNGIVTILDMSDELSHWIILAMKCLAKWPNASGNGSCLPKYPGFEHDVFKVIRDYFCNIQDSLVPSSVYRIMAAAYTMVSQSPHSYSLKDNNQELSPLADDRSERLTSALSPFKYQSFGSSCFQGNRPLQRMSGDMGFETAFIHPNPTTRVVQLRNHSPDALLAGRSGNNSNFEKVSLARSKSLNRQSIELGLTDSSVVQRRKMSSSKLFGDATNESLAPRRCLSFDQLHARSLSNKGFTCLNMLKNRKMDESSGCGRRIGRSETFSVMDKKLGNRKSRNDEKPEKSLPAFYRELNPVEQDFLFHSLNLCLLLVPPPKRRQLHMLLRMLNRIVDNKEIRLFPQGCTQFMLVKTFSPSVFDSRDKPMDEVLCCKLFDFLMDNCERIMMAPAELIRDVNRATHSIARSKLKNLDVKENLAHLNFCQQVSPQTYETQCQEYSQKGLKYVLDAILEDKKLSDKDKRKRLKEFQKLHPEVYAIHVSTQSTFELREQLKKSASTHSQKTFLEKLVNLRL